jgi:phospholipid/cholesterol/gamma-HCH transport system substrate-binding protein
MTSKHKPKTELYVGIFVFCGLVLLGGLILKFGDFRYYFRSKYPLTLVLNDAGNLIASAPVRRGGVEIGRVTKDPTLIEGISGVKVPLVIYQEFHISKESDFSLKTDGLIGDMYVEVTPPLAPSGKMFASGEEIRGKETSDISSTAGRVADKSLLVLEDIRASLSDLKVAIGKISTGVLAEENLNNFRDALKKLNQTVDTINNKVLSEANTTSLAESLQSLKDSTQKLSGTLASVDDTIKNADKVITSKLGPALDEFGKAGTSFRKAGEAVGMAANDIRGSNGVVPALIKDAKLRDDFTSLISNLRRNGVLWYKDDAEKEKLKQQANPANQPKRGFFSR